MRQNPRPRWVGFCIALASVAAAAALRAAIFRAVGGGLPFLTFFPAVIAAALYGGRAAGLLAVALSAFAALLWAEPVGTPFVSRPSDVVGLVMFVLVGLLIVWLCERTLAAHGEADAAGLERARLAAIVDSSDDAIVSKNLDGIIQTWNNGAERIFGYTSEEAVGRPVLMLLPPDRRSEEPAILRG